MAAPGWPYDTGVPASAAAPPMGVQVGTQHGLAVRRSPDVVTVCGDRSLEAPLVEWRLKRSRGVRLYRTHWMTAAAFLTSSEKLRCLVARNAKIE